MIDIANGTISSGTNLQIYNANFTNAQEWILDSNRANESEQPVKDGVYLLENMANKNQTLDCLLYTSILQFRLHLQLQAFSDQLRYLKSCLHLRCL